MQEIKIPDIGDVDSVEVIELCVAVGDVVGPDDPIIVIESDKASMEVPAGASGTIGELVAAIGDSVSEGDVIARLEAGDAAATPAPAAETAAAPQAAPEPTSAPESTPAAATPAAEASSVTARVPDIGDVDEVVVIEVLVNAGDTVAVGDLLVVLESDKASMEVPAEHAGTIDAVHVTENDPVREGSELATIAVTAASATSAVADAPPAAPPPASEPVATSSADSEAVAAPTAQPEAASVPPTSAGATVYAGPAARRLARELGVDLATVAGSGDKGRVLKDDVKAHVKKTLKEGVATAASGGMGIPPIPPVDFSRYGETELQPLGRTRVVGAQNLHRSWLNIPHVTNHDQADVTELEAFRKSLKGEAERRGAKLTPLAFIIKALTHVLAEFPTFNASLDASGENYVLKHYCHMGMAVDTPGGLVVPVIRDADQLGVWELSAAIIELAEAARDRKLKPAQMSGGSFSVSSLGNIGGTGFTPIINPPEVAILGVGRLDTGPVWNGERFVPRKLLPLSLSYDHRAINGGEAGRFLARLREVLGDVRQLIL
ncbi:MAG: dihydrolipoyllysine-residue acetyltransferase [Pseudomonadota bacterium]